jgi:hypothetical protein
MSIDHLYQQLSTTPKHNNIYYIYKKIIMNPTLNPSYIPFYWFIMFLTCSSTCSTIFNYYYVNSFHININTRKKNTSIHIHKYNKYDHPYLNNLNNHNHHNHHNHQLKGNHLYYHHHSPLFLSSTSHHIHSLQEKGEELPSNNNNSDNKSTPLSMSIDELSLQLNGKGRALTTWDCYKIGLDPLYFFSHENNEVEEEEKQMKLLWDHTVYNILSKSASVSSSSSSSSSSFHHDDPNLKHNDNPSDQITTKSTSINSIPKGNNQNNNYRTKFTKQYMPMKRQDIHNNQEGKGLSKKILNQLSSKLYPNSLGIEYSIASLVNLQRSNDGTVKLLLKLNNHKDWENVNDDDDGGGGGGGDDDDKELDLVKHNNEKEYFIESVIIPWYDRSNPTSTLCVSTQVGCAQGKVVQKKINVQHLVVS